MGKRITRISAYDVLEKIDDTMVAGELEITLDQKEVDVVMRDLKKDETFEFNDDPAGYPGCVGWMNGNFAIMIGVEEE